jgi:hypothetical protein
MQQPLLKRKHASGLVVTTTDYHWLVTSLVTTSALIDASCRRPLPCRCLPRRAQHNPLISQHQPQASKQVTLLAAVSLSIIAV